MKNRALVLCFVLAYAISRAFMLLVALSAQGVIQADAPYALYYLASFGPALVALVVTGLTEGGAGVRSLLGHLVIWRVPLRYYASAVAAPIALFGLAVLVNRVVAGTWPDLSLLGQIDYMPYLGIPGVLGLW